MCSGLCYFPAFTSSCSSPDFNENSVTSCYCPPCYEADLDYPVHSSLISSMEEHFSISTLNFSLIILCLTFKSARIIFSSSMIYNNFIFSLSFFYFLSCNLFSSISTYFYSYSFYCSLSSYSVFIAPPFL